MTWEERHYASALRSALREIGKSDAMSLILSGRLGCGDGVSGRVDLCLERTESAVYREHCCEQDRGKHHVVGTRRNEGYGPLLRQVLFEKGGLEDRRHSDKG